MKLPPFCVWPWVLAFWHGQFVFYIALIDLFFSWIKKNYRGKWAFLLFSNWYTWCRSNHWEQLHSGVRSLRSVAIQVEGSTQNKVTCFPLSLCQMVILPAEKVTEVQLSISVGYKHSRTLTDSRACMDMYFTWPWHAHTHTQKPNKNKLSSWDTFKAATSNFSSHFFISSLNIHDLIRRLVLFSADCVFSDGKACKVLLTGGVLSG